MIDKEMAKDYADNINGLELTCSLLSAKDKNHAYKLGRYDGFLAGLKVGRPKWHKVADGDLPKDENRVLLYFGDDDYNDGQFIRGRFLCGSCGWFDVEEVVAWCEIPLYEEE